SCPSPLVLLIVVFTSHVTVASRGERISNIANYTRLPLDISFVKNISNNSELGSGVLYKKQNPAIDDQHSTFLSRSCIATLLDIWGKKIVHIFVAVNTFFLPTCLLFFVDEF